MKRITYHKQSLVNELIESTVAHAAEVKNNYLFQPDETLNRKPKDGGWSIAQCAEHLNTYSAYYLPLIKKALDSHQRNEESYTSSWLGGYFVEMMKSTGNTKYKAVKRHVPASVLDGQAVMNQFLAHEQVLLECLRKAESADLNQGKIPLSILPLLRLNLGDILHFLVIHNQRHLRQARRINVQNWL